jgi:high-affinity nickel permease
MLPIDPKLATMLALGFLLGIEHAFDADHVVAVSTLVTRERNLKKSSFLGIFWGIGHTTTLLIVGLAILTLKLTIPNRLALSMEFVVGAMLVLLGGIVLKDVISRRIHLHSHSHGDESHLHLHEHREEKAHAHNHVFKPEFRSLLVGMVHGLAGSAALVLLVLTTAPSISIGLFYIIIFGIGSISGMMLISTLISLPFIMMTARKFEHFSEKIRTGAGLVSIGLGVVIMLQIGIGKGLF